MKRDLPYLVNCTSSTTGKHLEEFCSYRVRKVHLCSLYFTNVFKALFKTGIIKILNRTSNSQQPFLQAQTSPALEL